MSEVVAINRGAVVLEPTEHYLRWAQSGSDPVPDLTLESLSSEVHVYLMPHCDGDQDAEAWLRPNYLAMFREELRSWCTDEASWPEDSSYESFRRFFDVHFASVVFDLGKGSIRREV